ncbi:hypothetical protein [Candidatus Nitrosocosmicus oleophilus]|nr:hypothetical protein [Candidatus Nitrosocosmicus oleophilus]
MKYPTITLGILGILSVISLTLMTLPSNSVEARHCYVMHNPYPGLPDEIRCLADEISLSLPSDFCPECSELNPQPLPPVINLMINPSELDSTQTLKITNVGNGTTLVNVVNATN